MLWSKDAASQPAVVWQLDQLPTAKAAPAVECTGLLVPCQVVRWHCEFPQLLRAICKLKLPLMWHRLQVIVVCWPVSGKPVVLWSNVPAAQVVMGWHDAHCAAVVGKPAAMWFGTFPPMVVVL